MAGLEVFVDGIAAGTGLVVEAGSARLPGGVILTSGGAGRAKSGVFSRSVDFPAVGIERGAVAEGVARGEDAILEPMSLAPRAAIRSRSELVLAMLVADLLSPCE